ncbi:hypothetical protein [Gottfriedia acidiceleris]|uniref:hypothetical protein n=1 Tax=Gottfriedia acidiceleris TaxID=371036 RepID=UPI00101D0515|nr:hypothetical protein [Gottfriedia acidiceleris]
MRYKKIILPLFVLIFGWLVFSDVPIEEKYFLWLAYICVTSGFAFILWELFAFIWILILQKKSYDRFFFWIKPKRKSKRKLKKKRKKVKRK